MENSGFYYKKNEFFIEKLSWKQLIEKYGTPLVVFSKKKITHNINNFRSAFLSFFPEMEIFYPLKANYCPRLLKIFLEAGLNVEVMSEMEYAIARKTGFPANQIIWNGPGKSTEELKLMIRDGIKMINVDSNSELNDIEILAKKAKKVTSVSLRIIPDKLRWSHPNIKNNNRFGFVSDDVISICNQVKKMPFLKFQGIHLHMHINQTDIACYRESIKDIMPVLKTIENHGFPISILNLGGGFPTNSVLTSKNILLKDFAKEIAKNILTLHNRPKLYFEPGRNLIGDAAVALTKIIRRKLKKHNNWLITDIASNVLIPLDTAMYQVYPVKLSRTKMSRFHIGDHLCSFFGNIQENVKLPSTINENDYLIIKNIGAYTLSMAEHYGTLIPSSILVDGQRITRIYDSLSIPEFLRSLKF